MKGELLKIGLVTNRILKKLFPTHGKEIENLSRELACGCSLCVWRVLKQKYDLELPKTPRFYVFG